MSKVAAQASLESDRPCAGLGEDLLGRGGVVKGLSQAILNRTDRESMSFQSRVRGGGQWQILLPELNPRS